MLIITPPKERLASHVAKAILMEEPMLCNINEEFQSFEYDAEYTGEPQVTAAHLLDGAVIFKDEEKESIEVLSLIQEVDLKWLNTEYIPKLVFSIEDTEAVTARFMESQTRNKQLVQTALMTIDEVLQTDGIGALFTLISEFEDIDYRVTPASFYNGLFIGIDKATQEIIIGIPDGNNIDQQDKIFLPYSGLVSDNIVTYWCKPVISKEEDDEELFKMFFVELEAALSELPGSFKDGLGFTGMVLQLNHKGAENEAQAD